MGLEACRSSCTSNKVSTAIISMEIFSMTRSNVLIRWRARRRSKRGFRRSKQRYPNWTGSASTRRAEQRRWTARPRRLKPRWGRCVSCRAAFQPPCLLYQDVKLEHDPYMQTCLVVHKGTKIRRSMHARRGCQCMQTYFLPYNRRAF